MTYTHKGWFYGCPIYITPNSEWEGADIAARHRWLDWWLHVNLFIFDSIALFSPYEEPYPFKITEELETPITVGD